MKLQNRARNIATGEVITAGSVSITGPDGNVLAASVTIDTTTGLWSFTSNGQPGYAKQTFAYQGQTKVIEGDSWGQNGWWCEGELIEVLRSLGDGVMRGIDAELSVTPVSGLTLQVGLGQALIRGVLFPIYDTGAANSRVTIAANNGSNPRKDRVVIRLERVTAAASGQTPATYAGRCYLAVLQGTAAATPTVPAVTQNASVWEMPLATISVAAGASSVSSGNIDQTDRTYTADFATSTHMHGSGGISDFVEAAQDAVGSILTDSSSIDFTYNDATPSITAAVLYGGTGNAATAARSDHNHTGTYATANHTHSLAGKISVRTNGNPPTVQPGKDGQDTVACSAGEFVVGGGCVMTASSSTVAEMYPGAQGGIWNYTCRMTNNTDQDQVMTVYAICIQGAI